MTVVVAVQMAAMVLSKTVQVPVGRQREGQSSNKQARIDDDRNVYTLVLNMKGRFPVGSTEMKRWSKQTRAIRHSSKTSALG